jgi:hypothetical protein
MDFGSNSKDFEFKNSKLPVSYVNFQKVAKNIETFCFLSTFTSNKIFDSKIWLNYFLDDYHFGYITNPSKETLVSYVQSKLVQQVWSKHVYWEMMYMSIIIGPTSKLRE